MKKILIGGSPCTYWSIAQKNNREIEAEGIGWELFNNYLIAKEKFQPDYFLYENNKSAAQPIKDQISQELGVPLQYINSALVSAQNRQRFYAHNIPNVEQPEDRGILLNDILESGIACRNEKSYCLDANYYKGGNLTNFNKQSGQRLMVAEPIKIGNIGSDSQAHRVYSPDGKSINLVANGGCQGAKTGLYAVPIAVALNDDGNGKSRTIKAQYYKNSVANAFYTSTYGATLVIESAGGSQQPIYEVKNGLITIKEKQYPIKLQDGYYMIRKLTPVECERLQTLPDNYTAGISNTQRYKCIGNGWTAEVIIHILKHMNIPKDEEIVVLSMYDGIATGRYCLEQLGYTNITYYAYEIDQYAKQIAQKNYPDIIQCGDAFDVRKDDWFLSSK